MNFPGKMVIPRDAASCDLSEMQDTTIAARSCSGRWYSSSEHSHVIGFSASSEGAHSRLHGRQGEISKMEKCFMDVASDGAAQLLLVSGVSGSGKSALVEQMRDFVTSSKCHGFFCQGKFEQSLLGGATNEPLSALITAFSDVIDFILNQGGKLHERSQAVSRALGPDIATLVHSVPNLSLLLGAAAKSDTAQYLNSAGASKEGASTKTSAHLAILFRNFLRSLTSEEAPILLFLDDLQFADEDSLDVFRALVTDSLLKHVLVVGSYRSNETSMEHLLNPTGSSKTLSFILPITSIEVGDLDLTAINVGLAEKLSLDKETTEPLSKVILQKSGGNPFYVTQYLQVLQEKELLAYQEDTETWSWDLDQILMMTNVSNNVLELVSHRLEGMPDEIRALLILIAFVGFRFDLDLVETILRQLALTGSSTTYILENQCVVSMAVSLFLESKSRTQNRAAIEDVLQKAIKDGLIEKCSGGIFKFTHDRIQQALYGIVKAESARSELHYHIGHALSSLEFSNTEDRKTTLFFVADQLNRGISHIIDEIEVIKLSETNLKVGKVSASRAAYQSAATYLRSGMNLLDDVKYWSTHYSLMIDMCSSTAEIEAKISNFERSREICRIVLLRALSLDDKVRAYVCLVSSYCIQESLDDAVTVGMEFLSQVGVDLPKNPTLAHVVVNLIQTKKCMYKVSDSMILESPMMSDMKMAKAIEVLNTLATTYYIMANAGEMFAIIVMRMVQLTRRFGLAETTAHGFAYFGLLTSNLGDREQALRYGNLALALMQAPSQDNKIVEARVLTLVYHFVMWWKIPLADCTKPFIRGASVGKQQGDLEWAYFSGNGVIASMFHSGYHLYETLDIARGLCREMIEYEVHSPCRMTLPYWQIVENLVGHSDNTYKLTGNAMDQDEMVRKAEENKNLFALEKINSARLCAAVIFQNWDLAFELASLVIKGIKFLDAHFWGFTVRLYLGLTYSESYMRYGKLKDRRRLLKIIRKLTRWEHMGVGNCTSLCLILQAELAATKRCGKVTQKESTKAMYTRAIDQCHTHNLIHYRAITSERALRVCELFQDKEGAAEFMTDAVDFYHSWGANAKVDQMEEMYFYLRVRG